MKTVLVYFLLTLATLSLIILMDLVLHFPLSDIMSKELKPFKVTEVTNYVILGVFGSYFVLKSGIKYVQKIRKKTNENSPS
ncbi:hypothetical protein [Bacillus sp. FJAT-29814]|uniref:hypothetical protein n=1 Tax=Bacillus sp. FJAT-29814 TaxID=1729688 RepID=UPI000ADDE3D7|nr:hypothetical protein [Bacillus sp. FJAT-29814]